MHGRYLIINADDFGICRETNEAIEHLFNEGRITSTTVMAPARESGDAIARAAKNKKIRMGLHITLNSDFSGDPWRSVAPAGEVPSLLDGSGNFYHDTERFYNSAKEQEVSTEINAQYSYVAESGYKPTHADSHCGTLYGLTGKPFIREAFEFCAKRGFPFRLPKSGHFIRQRFGGDIPPAVEAAHNAALAYAEKLGIRLPDDIVTNPFSVGEIKDYGSLKEFYLNVIRNLGEGVTEMFLHPSKENAQMMSCSAEWKKRVWEYRFLMDDEMLRTIGQEDIKLVSWDTAPFSA